MAIAHLPVEHQHLSKKNLKEFCPFNTSQCYCKPGFSKIAIICIGKVIVDKVEMPDESWY